MIIPLPKGFEQDETDLFQINRILNHEHPTEAVVQ